MKNLICSFTTLLLFVFLQSCTDHKEPYPEPELLSSEVVFRGLKAPIGITLDDQNNIWVAEAGTGNGNDGSIAMITPSGTKTIFVTGLKSITNEGSSEGVGHLLFRNGTLYFLHGSNGMLYTADVSSFKPGDAAVQLSSLPVQDIGTYVRSQALTDPLNSNTYNLTFGPDDDLYIVDSGSNAIIKRNSSKNGELSVFAHFPDVAKGVEAVPTGIVYDGTRFFVSTLTGFPFALGNAKIFQVEKSGMISVYKSDFTTLTGITLSVNNKPIVIQHGEFGEKGFGAMTGKVLDENGKMLLGNISRPTDIIRASAKSFYLLSYTDGTISKLSY